MNDMTRYPPPASGAGQSYGLARQEPRNSLVDVLDRVLDKGVVIAGDIAVNLLDIELLTIKIRLLVASVDKAKEMGIDWWERDPQLSGKGAEDGDAKKLKEENRELRERLARLEAKVAALPEPPTSRKRKQERQ
jgi:hypothetical protein